jgi:hypothetical protein
MRYRLGALAVALGGFLAINYFSNLEGQQALSRRIEEEARRLPPVIEEQFQRELEGIRLLEALVDTLDALGVQTEAGARLRQHYRRSMGELERLRTAEFLRATLWRQTLLHLVWAVIAAVGLLPVGGWMDIRTARRRESEPAAPSVSPRD